MYTIMFGILIAYIMNTATSNNKNIGSLSNIKIIINEVIKSCLRKNNRNIYSFVFSSRTNYNIYSRFILFCDDFYIFSAVSWTRRPPWTEPSAQPEAERSSFSFFVPPESLRSGSGLFIVLIIYHTDSLM